MRTFHRWSCLAIAIALCGGCGQAGPVRGTAPSSPTSRKQVLVTNYPLLYFAERIAGGSVDAVFPMTGDGDPAFWTPDAKTIARYQAADAIIINGATFEKWLMQATLPEARIHDSSAKFADKFIQVADAVTHSHGPEGEHSHAGTSFTTWIDFEQARQQAGAIAETLSQLVPERKADFEQNLAALVADLKVLDDQMQAIGKTLGDRPLVASHPVYDYLARRYELQLKTVQWEPEEVPADHAIEELKKLLDGHVAKVMIWEGTPAPASVEKLKSLGLESIVFDPCGNRPKSGDWLTVMRANVDSLRTWANANK